MREIHHYGLVGVNTNFLKITCKFKQISSSCPVSHFTSVLFLQPHSHFFKLINYHSPPFHEMPSDFCYCCTHLTPTSSHSLLSCNKPFIPSFNHLTSPTYLLTCFHSPTLISPAVQALFHSLLTRLSNVALVSHVIALKFVTWNHVVCTCLTSSGFLSAHC